MSFHLFLVYRVEVFHSLFLLGHSSIHSRQPSTHVRCVLSSHRKRLHIIYWVIHVDHIVLHCVFFHKFVNRSMYIFKDFSFSYSEFSIIFFYRRPSLTRIRHYIGLRTAFDLRFYTGKILTAAVVVYYGTYYFLCNANNWERKSGRRVHESRTQCVLGDPGFPKPSDRHLPNRYADGGF